MTQVSIGLLKTAGAVTEIQTHSTKDALNTTGR